MQDGAKKQPSLEPDPATAPVVERIFGMAEAGRGILDITRTLNDEGIANPTGRLWSKNGVHIILKNETYTGTLVWGVDSKDKADPVRVEKAFPAIVSKSRFRRVNRKLRSRAPMKSHPRRVGSTYLLSGMVKCKACNRALSGQDAKSGKFAYYVCQSLLKRGSGTCDAPRLNARRFEEKVVGKIRENVLTESNIRALVKMVDEEMDGVAKEQRQKLETIEAELVDVKHRLGRLYDLAETTDLDIDDFKPRIREHRERQERLEATAAEARAMLSQRREVLDDVETITAYALDMSMFLNESELTERRAFIESFVKEIVVMPDNAVVRYTIPMPDDSPIPGTDVEEMALNGSVLSTVKYGGSKLTVGSTEIRAELNNNVSERLQGTYRSRTKTMRGMDALESGQRYLDGWTLYYNLFREHESLGGQPPARKAMRDAPYDEWADVVRGGRVIRVEKPETKTVLVRPTVEERPLSPKAPKAPPPPKPKVTRPLEDRPTPRPPKRGGRAHPYFRRPEVRERGRR